MLHIKMNNMRFLLLALSILLFSSSCQNILDLFKEKAPSSSSCKIRVEFVLDGKTGSRTIVPDFTTSIDSYSITLTSKDGFKSQVATVDLGAGAATFSDVEAGKWDISVTALKSTLTVGTGSLLNQTVSSSGNLILFIPIQFSQADGVGNLSFSVLIPIATSIDFVQGTIGNSTLTPSLADYSDAQFKIATFSVEGLTSGIQKLVMTFRRGGESGAIAGIYSESVNIWSNITSDKWIDATGTLVATRTFAATDFFSSNANLSNLSVSKGTLVFSSETTTYDLGTTYTPTFTLTATGSINSQYLQYRNNAGNLVDIKSGTATSNIALSAGDNAIVVNVTAPDKTTAKTYTINIMYSTDKAITSFSFANPQATGVINKTSHTISVTVPYKTAVILTPTFAIAGASVSPRSGVPQNFTTEINYTVRSGDGTAVVYVVTVIIAKNYAKEITKFWLQGSNPYHGIVNESNHTIAVVVPYGTDIKMIRPFANHTGASISYVLGTNMDFTNPVTITVTAADGTTQAYIATCTIALNQPKEITSFSFKNPDATGVVTETNHTISITVPYGTVLTALVPTIGITGASISPASGVAQSFTNPVTYTITATDGTTQAYVVTRITALNQAKAITSFSFTNPAATGVVTEASHSISIVVPFGTNLSGLVASFTTTGASIKIGTVLQASGTTANNFTSSQAYTVTAADGSTQAYAVTVYVAAATPTFSPPGGLYTSTQSVTIRSTTSGAIIWYTIDGSDPTSSSTMLSCLTPVASISVPLGITLRARANATGYMISSEGAASYQQRLLAMLPVAGGSFNNGASYISVSSFTMSITEITQAQYLTVTGDIPSYFSTVTRGPVEQVTWYDAVEFCNKLSTRDSRTPVYEIIGRTPAVGYPITSATVTATWINNGYRLPTEAEWQYAAAGGLKGNLGDKYAGSNSIEGVGWDDTNAGSTTHEVRMKYPNALGLYDMSGNVREWCWDWYGTYPSWGDIDPKGADTGTYRVNRGGGISDFSPTITWRIYNPPDYRSCLTGFRVVAP